MGGGLNGFDPQTGRPNNGNPQRGYQIPPPGQGLGQLGDAERAYVNAMQQSAQSQQGQQQQGGGYEMPPPPQDKLVTYKFGKAYELDPNATYYHGLGGIKRAEIL